MTLKEMVELVQQHHPSMGAQEIIKLLNRASDDFCARTRMIESTSTIATVANQRWYTLPVAALEIKHVDYDGKRIARFKGRPRVRDIT
mgnify:CR=1 FL=1